MLVSLNDSYRSILIIVATSNNIRRRKRDESRTTYLTIFVKGLGSNAAMSSEDLSEVLG